MFKKNKFLCVAVFIFLVIAGVSSVAAEQNFEGLKIPDLTGLVMTVEGPVAPESLGETLMHEHLFLNFWLPLDQPDRWEKLRSGLKPPTTRSELEVWNMPFSAQTRGLLLPMKEFQRNRDGYTLNDLSVAVKEVEAFKALGGKTIVDVTPMGLNRQPEKVVALAKKTGVNIVAGTGFYRKAWHPEDIDERSMNDLTRFIVKELVVGINDTKARAGIIGEIPAEDLVTEPQDSNEVRVLRAAARASRLTGAAITLHSDFSNMKNLPLSLDILEEEGADLSRVVVGHVANLASKDLPMLEDMLARGVYLEFDVLGNPWQLLMPTPPMLEAIVALLKKGYASQMLVSQDVCTKFQLLEFGGYGFTFFHAELIPYLKMMGVGNQDIEQILVHNPKRILTFVAPQALAANQ